jgi:hypothetical protein
MSITAFNKYYNSKDVYAQIYAELRDAALSRGDTAIARFYALGYVSKT